MSNNIFSKNIEKPKKIFSELIIDKNNNVKNTFYLSSHKFYKKDEINENSTLMCVINKELEGQQWKIDSKYEGIYEIKYNLDDYKMKNWNIFITNDENIILLKDENSKKTAFILIEKDNNNNQFYIQDALSGKYLGIDTNKKRDKISFYLNLTNEKKFIWTLKNIE